LPIDVSDIRRFLSSLLFFRRFRIALRLSFHYTVVIISFDICHYIFIYWYGRHFISPELSHFIFLRFRLPASSPFHIFWYISFRELFRQAFIDITLILFFDIFFFEFFLSSFILYFRHCIWYFHYQAFFASFLSLYFLLLFSHDIDIEIFQPPSVFDFRPQLQKDMHTAFTAALLLLIFSSAARLCCLYSQLSASWSQYCIVSSLFTLVIQYCCQLSPLIAEAFFFAAADAAMLSRCLRWLRRCQPAASAFASRRRSSATYAGFAFR